MTYQNASLMGGKPRPKVPIWQPGPASATRRWETIRGHAEARL